MQYLEDLSDSCPACLDTSFGHDSHHICWSVSPGLPRTLENRENGEKKFPAGKNLEI